MFRSLFQERNLFGLIANGQSNGRNSTGGIDGCGERTPPSKKHVLSYYRCQYIFSDGRRGVLNEDAMKHFPRSEIDMVDLYQLLATRQEASLSVSKMQRIDLVDIAEQHEEEADRWVRLMSKMTKQ